MKDYVFPVFCLRCEQEGAWLCVKCAHWLDIQPQLYCPVCHRQTMQGEPCSACAESSSLEQHIAMTKYVEDALIGKLIHVFKYQYAEEVMTVMQSIISHFVKEHHVLFRNIDLIIPVPLHKKRYAERGFNQASYIGKALSDALGVPCIEQMLVRSRHTSQQATLDRAGRMKNVQDAFMLDNNADVKGMNILLVDDVYTTGATMQSCAQVLAAGQAASIRGCSFARG